MNLKEEIALAVRWIRSAKHITAFSGAGISVESGIPPFRGEGGLWNRYDPTFIYIDKFLQSPIESWKLIKEVFYDFFGQAKPNPAHIVLAKMEQQGLLQAVITQNIDNLHQEAGSRTVYEFHGNTRNLICLDCERVYPVKNFDLNNLPPRCKDCKTVLKPDFVFFGEPIPEPAGSLSNEEAYKADLFMVIGTTGEVMPAAVIPRVAQWNGAKIIEINPAPTLYTPSVTDLFLQGKAGEIMEEIGIKLLSVGDTIGSPRFLSDGS